MEDWDVSASDDEWAAYNPPEAKKVDSLFIPDRLAGLFKKIEEDKVVPITSGYPRVGFKNEMSEGTNPTNNTTTTSNNGSDNTPNITPPPTQEERESPPGEISEAPPEDKSFEAFNFNDNDGDKPSMKRKTPGSGKRGKKEKVGSMSNVVNDLLRHKYLDELESSREDVQSTLENKGAT